MNVEWLLSAERTLETQLSWIAERNPQAALDMGGAIEAAVSRLADFPQSARPGRVPGTWELVVPASPFIVVYRIEATGIVILRVLHGARRWPPE